MLVLTRLQGESVLLDGGRIRIMLVAVRKNGQVRIGFDVAPDVDVVREEIAEEWLKHRRGPSPYGGEPEEGRGRRSPGRRAR